VFSGEAYNVEMGITNELFPTEREERAQCQFGAVPNDITHVDVGGGLGVDYDGSRSTRSASVNYTMREYASDVVYTIGTACRTEGLPMPHLISESGRALTAHHALLLVNVTDVESQIEPVPPRLREEPHPLLVEMSENLEALTSDRIEEVFHDAIFAKERTQEYFASGVFSLRDKADAEQLYLALWNRSDEIQAEGFELWRKTAHVTWG